MSETPTLPAPPEPQVILVPVLVTGERIVVTGAPLSGSARIAAQLASERCYVLRETDETIALGLGWSEASAHVAEWFDAPGSWIVHGVAAPRALRKWLAAHPEGKPCDAVIFDRQPLQPLLKGQEAMRKGIETVWAEILPELERRGVEIEIRECPL